MIFFILDHKNKFSIKHTIHEYKSLVWNEGLYGYGDFVLELTPIQFREHRIALETSYFCSTSDSIIIMVINSIEYTKGDLDSQSVKVTGITFNNLFRYRSAKPLFFDREFQDKMIQDVIKTQSINAREMLMYVLNISRGKYLKQMISAEEDAFRKEYLWPYPASIAYRPNAVPSGVLTDYSYGHRTAIEAFDDIQKHAYSNIVLVRDRAYLDTGAGFLVSPFSDFRDRIIIMASESYVLGYNIVNETIKPDLLIEEYQASKNTIQTLISLKNRSSNLGLVDMEPLEVPNIKDKTQEVHRQITLQNVLNRVSDYVGKNTIEINMNFFPYPMGYNYDLEVSVMPGDIITFKDDLFEKHEDIRVDEIITVSGPEGTSKYIKVSTFLYAGDVRRDDRLLVNRNADYQFEVRRVDNVTSDVRFDTQKLLDDFERVIAT